MTTKNNVLAFPVSDIQRAKVELNNTQTEISKAMTSITKTLNTSYSNSVKSVKFGHLSHEDIRTVIRQLQEFVEDVIVGSTNVDPNYPIAYRQNFISAGSDRASKVHSGFWPLVEHIETELARKLENEPTDLHKYDVNVLGMLANRVTFTMGNDMMIKFAINDFGRAENKHEQSVWIKASADLKTVLVPIKASAADGSWLIMEFAEPYPETSHHLEWLKGNAEDVQDLGYQSPYEINDPKLWGILDSETVLVEYGFVPTV